MNRQLPKYRSFLVRFWQMDNAGHPLWRAALQEPGSEQQIYFESLADLCTYLATQFAEGETKIDSGDEPASQAPLA